MALSISSFETEDMVQRLSMVANMYLLLPAAVHTVRELMITQAVSFITTVPGFLWSASIHVEMPQRLAPAWVAIGIDLKVGVLAIAVTRGGKYVFKTRRK
ncbi:unnamed protein product [Diplocarpon coronariae]|nr:hypothetical protein JHW43_001873 [Diplocarpon mali]